MYCAARFVDDICVRILFPISQSIAPDQLDAKEQTVFFRKICPLTVTMTVIVYSRFCVKVVVNKINLSSKGKRAKKKNNSN